MGHKAMLLRLAIGRRRRLRNGRPVFGLTRDEIARSTRTAMDLAKARPGEQR
jgi:hypothetical protein